MTKPINLYIQSRISDELSFNRVEFHSSKRQDCGKTKEHEIGSLRKIVDAFIAQGLSPKELDGFFFGFHIPQIGKEFDLLKFSQTEVINIEFKSQAVPEEQILTQLIKNKHYLAHLGKEEILYTIITDTMTCYEMCVMNYPEENGSFPSMSGATFSLNTAIPTSVKTDENGFFTSVDGEYRVYGVKVLDKESGEYRDLDLNKKYVLAGFNYHLLAQGDGMAMLGDAKPTQAEGTLDIELLENYIVDHLGGTIGEEYAEPQGRITFTEG